jgi:phage virion morphogenesis protein
MSIEIQGLETIQSKLKSLESRTSPAQMKSTMHTIGNMIKNEIEESFENQSSPFGTKWKDLKDATKISKKKRNKSSLILRSDGDLQDKWIVKADNDSVEVFGSGKSASGYEYGKVHQWGSTKPSGRGSGIVARPFLPITKNGELLPRVESNILKYLERKIGENI